MYKSYYGLKRNPFDLAPDSTKLFVSETHKEGLAALRYGILTQKGFVLLTGGVGTGKTTLINVLVKSLRPEVKVSVLSNPILTSTEFFHYIGSKLGLPCSDKADFLLDFTGLLQKCAENHQKVLLIIDEAHVLPVELLEEIRLLSNLAGDGFDVLSIFLVGQPELLERLADERLLPLRQRIGISFHLDALSFEDTGQYILFRLHKAGAGNAHLFSEKAVEAIHRTTHGNPRLINVLCDHALLTGFSYGKLVIDEEIIRECIGELNLPGGIATYDSQFFSQPKRKVKKMIVLTVVFFLVLLAVLSVFSYRMTPKIFGMVVEKIHNLI